MAVPEQIRSSLEPVLCQDVRKGEYWSGASTKGLGASLGQSEHQVN